MHPFSSRHQVPVGGSSQPGFEDSLYLFVVEVVPGCEDRAGGAISDRGAFPDYLHGGVYAAVARAERVLGVQCGDNALLDGR